MSRRTMKAMALAKRRHKKDNRPMSTYKRLLIVDDEEQVIFVLRNSLRKLGSLYEIVTATSGYEALDKIRQAPFDVVITDLKMPGMDGIALTAAIRAVDPQTRVIWATAHNQWEAEARRLGVFRYVLKPLDVDELRQVALEGLEASVASGDSTRPVTSAGLPSRNVSLLILDDDENLRRIFGRALARAGYTVYDAASLEQARALLAHMAFDVFLCDIQVGGERGTDLLREQMDWLNQAGTQVIMMSSAAQYRDECADLGIEFYMEKPVSLGPLVTLVNRLTANRSPNSEMSTQLPTNFQEALQC
jgi:DNA-binding NtrC family response regulator